MTARESIAELEDASRGAEEALDRLVALNRSIGGLTGRLRAGPWDGEEFVSYLQLRRQEREAFRDYLFRRRWYDVELQRLRRRRFAQVRPAPAIGPEAGAPPG